jgi:hypothetical protein
MPFGGPLRRVARANCIAGRSSASRPEIAGSGPAVAVANAPRKNSRYLALRQETAPAIRRT